MFHSRSSSPVRQDCVRHTGTIRRRVGTAIAELLGTPRARITVGLANRKGGRSVIGSVFMTLRFRLFRRRIAIGVIALLGCACACSSTAGAREASHSTATHVTRLPDTALTPNGWSALGLGGIQISVPPGWFVEDPGTVCGEGVPEVFIDQTPSAIGCPLPNNVVELSTAAKTPLAHARRGTINSIPVTETTSSSGSMTTVTVRAIGMQLRAHGPLAERVVATLTHSPYSVVRGSSVRSIPPQWQHVDFGGIRFSVPGTWTTSRSTAWGGCPGNIEADVLALSTAQALSNPGCTGPPGTAASLAAQPGMVVGSGPSVAHAPADATCLRHNDLRICIDPPPLPVGGFAAGHEVNLLTAQVTVPNHVTVDQIEIGLTGTGVTPLEIFDSMRPVG
jgi:hypothetical protein